MSLFIKKSTRNLIKAFFKKKEPVKNAETLPPPVSPSSFSGSQGRRWWVTPASTIWKSALSTPVEQ